jgi:hypothetical protein
MSCGTTITRRQAQLQRRSANSRQVRKAAHTAKRQSSTAQAGTVTNPRASKKLIRSVSNRRIGPPSKTHRHPHRTLTPRQAQARLKAHNTAHKTASATARAHARARARARATANLKAAAARRQAARRNAAAERFFCHTMSRNSTRVQPVSPAQYYYRRLQMAYRNRDSAGIQRAYAGLKVAVPQKGARKTKAQKALRAG